MTRILIGGLAALLGLAVLTTGCGEPGQVGQAMPAELYLNNPDYAPILAANTDLERSYTSYDSYERKVVLSRWKRDDASTPWSSRHVTKQVLSADFDISGVAVAIRPTPHIEALVVCGTNATTGTSVIEQWKFPDAASDTRTTLYRGTSLGFLCDVEVDPSLRYVLALTHDGSVYRIDLPSDADRRPPVLLYDTEEVPELESAIAIRYAKHVSDGSMFVIDQRAPGDDTVILRDADDDGALEGVSVLSGAQWEESGYALLSNFVPVHRTSWFPGWGF